MATMPCHISDGPQFEENHEAFHPPHGMQVIRDLPNKDAQGFVDDEIFEPFAKTGKSYLEAMTDYVLEGDFVEAGIVLQKAIVAAGETDAALQEWEKVVLRD